MTHHAYDGNGHLNGNGNGHLNGNGNSRLDGNGNGNGHGHGPLPARLQLLYTEQLAAIRAAECQAAEIFPDMAVVAADDGVASLFRTAAQETEVQLARLDRLIEALELTDELQETARKDFLDEARSVIAGNFDADTQDLDEAMLRSARRSLHYQIAGYESACATARRLGDYRTLDVLLQSLDEELATDSSLSNVVSRRSRLQRAI